MAHKQINNGVSTKLGKQIPQHNQQLSPATAFSAVGAHEREIRDRFVLFCEAPLPRHSPSTQTQGQMEER